MGSDTIAQSVLYIRADTNIKMGVGHVMRCIALAQTWQDQGGEVTFISRCESDTLKERIQSEGFRFIPLDYVCPDSSDLKNTLSILKSESSDLKHWIVLDGYQFTSEYQRSIRDEGYRLLVIDDMNHLSHYHANILLNQNIHAPDLKYSCDADTIPLLGSHYVLLRREFHKYRNLKRQIPDRAKNVLVTLGGADSDNMTLKVIQALKYLDEPDIFVRIIVGPANPYQDMLREALASSHFQAEFLINPLNMPELMAWADMAISAAGSTCWELAFMGVPFLIVVLAENQKDIALSLSANGVAINCCCQNEIPMDTFNKRIIDILCSWKKRALLSLKGKKLIDGIGATRVCKAIKI